MHVHITLVGRETAPVNNVIKFIYPRPDLIVFIHSTDTKIQLENILSVNEDFESTTKHRAICINPVEVYSIEKTANDLAEEFKNDSITVNITSGTKTWSILFALSFYEAKNATVLYIDQNNNLWNLKNKVSVNIESSDFFSHFKLYGNPLKKYREFSEYTEEDRKACKEIESFRKNCFNLFKDYFAVSNRELQKKLAETSSDEFTFDKVGSKVSWSKSGQNEHVEAVIVEDNEKKTRHTLIIDCPHAISLLFNSGWFEFKIAHMISNWKKARAIYLNCLFPTVKQNSDNIKNEVDIIVDTGIKILFVECKTQVTQSTDIDKFNTVVKTYGGNGSKGIVITEAKKKPDVKEKCEERKLLEFDLKSYSNPKRELIKYLNEQLKTINI